MVSVLRGAWRVLAPPLLRAAPPPLRKTPAHFQQQRHTSKQVKGHRKEPKPKVEKQEVEIKQRMSVEELARAMDRDCDHVLEVLSNTSLDSVLGLDSVLDQSLIKEVVKLSGMKVRWAKLSETRQRPHKDVTRRPPPDPALLRPRPPVVTIMGHVDHGKTTLLDALRASQLASAEAGGITQHIGAFLVRLASGEAMTVLDTPGHAAFSSLRARGASATDIVILVIAADDGVMEQTVESIRHARNAGVPIIVAVNKCDKPQSDPDRVKRELLSHDVVCEEFGGDVQALHLSALKGEGLVELTEAVVALAEVLELKAEPDGAMEGTVIESRIDKGKGPVSTALVQRGALRRGAVLVSGRTWAKVRFMFDENGTVLNEAGPSRAVQVCGWRDLPSAGEDILEVESEQRAREVVSYRQHLDEQQRLGEEQKTIAANQEAHLRQYRLQRAELAHLSWRQRKSALYHKNKEVFATRPPERDTDQSSPRLSVVIKDVDGSVETLLNVLDSYDAQDQCELDLIHFGTGDVSETDVNLAHTFSGSVYGFNVSVSRSVQQVALKKNVPLKLHSVIYKLVEELKQELSEKLPSETIQTVLGEAGVLAVFEVSVGKRKVPVAGCRVQRGVLDKRQRFRVLREGQVLWEGSLSALKHHKDDVSSVKLGMDCGLSVDGAVDFKPGDTVQCYEEVQTPQTCSWTPPGF
ncbi:translation initiation factor IF-2, mitochondrial isoform X2 [Boleophthalmus pectinirostris]|uniref:translation initiation factor IF-2, mitochondrial isoform X2 n=1 Tax=Boleophthalmus pectinirostris TaxID=150288 RepID=UPI002432584E|nr:translation initiation factor IF-2, mitochondrial isoform X2 [Boleophthalmus pectinirostris]